MDKINETRISQENCDENYRLLVKFKKRKTKARKNLKTGEIRVIEYTYTKMYPMCHAGRS